MILKIVTTHALGVLSSYLADSICEMNINNTRNIWKITF